MPDHVVTDMASGQEIRFDDLDSKSSTSSLLHADIVQAAMIFDADGMLDVKQPLMAWEHLQDFKINYPAPGALKD